MFQDKKIAILGVTFKPNTDDMRDAPSLVILARLQQEGAVIHVCDPQGAKEGAELLPNVIWQDDPYEAAKDADALVVITEWNAFRGLDLDRLSQTMKSSIFVDLRNIYGKQEMREAGFSYSSIGKKRL